MNNVRVRIAPSPTGIPHIGNTRTALFNYLFARASGGTFILRIEDTDRKRLVEGAEEAIRKILTWLEMSIDEQFKQSERLELYKKHADLLVEKGVAHESEGAIWVDMPREKTYAWTDAIGNKKIAFSGSDQKEFVILKSDGYPTYHLASVVDDHDMNITHVIRGDEWISSTPKHLYLYELFGWKAPVFAHLPVILGPDKKKLSKRHGAESAIDYRKKGYIKEALINFMALLGWNPKNDQEILTIDELVSMFRLEDVNTGSPIFDAKKLEWMNGMHLRKLDNADLKNRLVEFDGHNTRIIEALGEGIVEIAKSRIKTLAEFKTQAEPFVSQRAVHIDNTINMLRSSLEEIQDWKQTALLEKILSFLKDKNMKFPDLYQLLFETKSGLPLADVFELMGKERTLIFLGK